MGIDPSGGPEVRRRCELAWAAGFFDGEGWANAIRAKGRRTVQPKTMINQASAEGVPEVLIRFRDAVGVGRVNGPHKNRKKRNLYRWTASSRADVARTFELIDPWLGAVKRDEFRVALGLVDSPTPVRAGSFAEEAAWAAGLFDGEGWTGLERHQSHEGFRTIVIAVTQADPQGAPEVLRRFEALAGRGDTYGPYRGKGRKLVYRWKAFGLDAVEAVMHLLMPWLGSVKRRQARVALDVLRVQPILPRGNPAWGPSHKKYCIRGHEYATARIRPYRPRSENGVMPRASKQCLVCVREQAKARRDAAKAKEEET